uniref:Uncharacterized protein n=1 Tax=Panagrolaimus sp. PS1159 TaxID=55785 RepID=A0AC35FRK0_9BILA
MLLCLFVQEQTVKIFIALIWLIAAILYTLGSSYCTTALEFLNSNRRILFCCPDFYVTRSLGEYYGGGVTIRVMNNESNKAWKITVCPEDRFFYVKHYNGAQEKRCFSFHIDNPCYHLNK